METPKRLRLLYETDPKLYFKVRARLYNGTMTRLVIDNNVCYLESELENWKPKTAGRKAKEYKK